MLANSKVQIERYTLNEEIDRGSFGIVYKAIDRINGNFVAVKKFPAIGQLNEKILEQFNQEVDLLIKLTATKNARILPILDFRIIGPYAYIITKYCEGGSLGNLLEKSGGKLNETKVLDIIKQIAQAFVELNVLLASNEVLIHRDLKPDNILFIDVLCNNIMLADFGLGKLSETNLLNQQQKYSSRIGTQAYMSIQVNDGEDYSSKCDVFSCGMIAFECLFGMTLMRKQLRELVTKRSYSDALWLTLNNNTQDLILGMLALDEKNRLDWRGVLAHPALQKVRLIQLIDEYESKRIIELEENNRKLQEKIDKLNEKLIEEREKNTLLTEKSKRTMITNTEEKSDCIANKIASNNEISTIKPKLIDGLKLKTQSLNTEPNSSLISAINTQNPLYGGLFKSLGQNINTESKSSLITEKSKQEFLLPGLYQSKDQNIKTEPNQFAFNSLANKSPFVLNAPLYNAQPSYIKPNEELEQSNSGIISRFGAILRLNTESEVHKEYKKNAGSNLFIHYAIHDKVISLLNSMTTPIMRLEIGSFFKEDSELMLLALALKKLKNLDALYLNFASLGDSLISDNSIKELALAIRYLTMLSRLGLNFQGFECVTDQSVREIAAAVSKLTSLMKFKLNFKGNWNITDDGVIEIAKVLPEFGLVKLHLKFSGEPGDVALEQLATILPQLTSLTTLCLNFEWNYFMTDNGVSRLMKGISELSYLEVLHLNFSGYQDNGEYITDLAIRNVEAAISKLKNLSKVRLNFSGNMNITKEGKRIINRLCQIYSNDQ